MSSLLTQTRQHGAVFYGLVLLWTFAFSGLPAGAQSQSRSDPGAGLIQALQAPNADMLRSHARFLSHDLLEGRAPGSHGGRTAAQFIATQFEALGLHPRGIDGTFLQPVALTGVQSEASLTIGSRQQTITLDAGREFVAWPEVPAVPMTADGEVVFVGFGIHAPQWDWNDFEGASLAGRVLLVLAGEPRLTDPSAFDGEQTTRYGTLRYKLDQAARVGAKGVLLVHSDTGNGWPWAVVRNTWTADRLFLQHPRESNLEFGAWVTEEAARRIVAASDRDFELLVRRAQQRSFRPIPIGAHGVMRIRGRVYQTEARNVLARLEGRDPAVADEHVIFLAHHDHLGIGDPAEGDSIYNGAEDNASGITAMLGVAAGFASAGVPPRRSILFLATTGAEAGHLGARAFVTDLPVSLENVVAVVNLDRANVRGRTTDIVGLGAEASGLGDYLAQVAAAEGMTVAEDPDPGAGWYYAGDHLPFARAGVAAMAIRPGPTVIERPDGWGRQEEQRYLRDRYHRPTDEYRDDWDLEGLLQQVHLLIRLGWLLAEADQFPVWDTDSEFGPAASQLRLRRMRQPRTQPERR